MILIRNVFQLKFGKAREASSLIKEGLELLKHKNIKSNRAMVDLVGQAYTLVLENTFENLADFESSIKEVMGREEWKSWYQEFIPLCKSSYREIFTIIEEN